MNISNIQNHKPEVKNLPNGTPLRENDARSETSGSDDSAKNKPKAVAFMATRPPKKTEAKPGPTPPSIDHNQVSFDFAAQPVNDNPDNPLPPIPVIDVSKPAPAEATSTPPSATEPQNEIVPTTPEPAKGDNVQGGTPTPAPQPVCQNPTPMSVAQASAPVESKFTPSPNEPAAPLPIPVIDGGALPPANDEAVGSQPPSSVPVDAPPSASAPQAGSSESEPGAAMERAQQADIPGSTAHPIFGYYMNFDSDQKSDPIPLKPVGPIPQNIDESTASLEAVAWFDRFRAVASHDRVGRIQMLIGEVSLLGPLFRKVELSTLNKVVALHIFVRDGFHKDLCSASGQPLFSDAAEFIDAFLQLHGIGDSATRVSRLLAGAKLWLVLVESNLPPPPTLNRIESIVSLPQEIAVQAYEELAVAAGGRVPALAAIKAKANELKGKTEAAAVKAAGLAVKTRQIDEVAVEARRLFELMGDPNCDVPKFKGRFGELVEKLEKLAAPPKPNIKPQTDRVGSDAPRKPCPVTIKVNGKDLVVKLHPKDSVLATAIHVRGLGKRWSKSDEQEWSVPLLPGPSARAAKIGQVGERLTRVLATFGYQGPDTLPAKM